MFMYAGSGDAGGHVLGTPYRKKNKGGPTKEKYLAGIRGAHKKVFQNGNWLNNGLR